MRQNIKNPLILLDVTLGAVPYAWSTLLISKLVNFPLLVLCSFFLVTLCLWSRSLWFAGFIERRTGELLWLLGIVIWLVLLAVEQVIKYQESGTSEGLVLKAIFVAVLVVFQSLVVSSYFKQERVK